MLDQATGVRPRPRTPLSILVLQSATGLLRAVGQFPVKPVLACFLRRSSRIVKVDATSFRNA